MEKYIEIYYKWKEFKEIFGFEEHPLKYELRKIFWIWGIMYDVNMTNREICIMLKERNYCHYMTIGSNLSYLGKQLKDFKIQPRITLVPHSRTQKDVDSLT